MRPIAALCLLPVLALVSSCASAGPGRKTSVPRATIRLSDGSVLHGVLPPQTLAVETLLGPLEVPVDKISSFRIEPPAGLVPIPRVDVPVEKSVPVTVRPRRRRLPARPLLFHCSFDSQADVEHPAVGPAGTFLRGDFVPGKVGNALYVPADTPVAEFEFPAGLLRDQGTIEFWAQIPERATDERFAGGGFPRFLCIWKDGSPGNPRSTYFQITGNDGMGHSGLSCMVSGAALATGTECLDSDPTGWHHYAMVWSAAGVPGAPPIDGEPATVALYVDGRLLSSVGNAKLSRAPGTLETFADFPILLGFPLRSREVDPAGNHVPFLIDEFKIWSEVRPFFPIRKTSPLSPLSPRVEPVPRADKPTPQNPEHREIGVH